MSLDDFWAAIDRQIEELKSAKTAADVIRICPHYDREAKRFLDSHGFFASSGGDYSVLDPLLEAGWGLVWMRAPYYWCAVAPDGTHITYVEGDLYPEKQRPLP